MSGKEQINGLMGALLSVSRKKLSSALILTASPWLAVADATVAPPLEDRVYNPLSEEVIVVGLRKANTTVITEDAEKLVNMPGSLGDPLGAISSLPGVILPRGGGAPAVRGSGPQDNRYYVDGMPAGYIFHDFNTSIFDENVLQDFQLFSAGFGVQYSQATGGVFDIRLRDPRQQPFTTQLSVSLLRAGILVESGLTENSAFYFSARQGMIQYFVSEGDDLDEEGIRIISPPEDSDYQFKYKWDMSAKHSLTVSAAGARDFAEAELSELHDFVQQNPDFAGDATIDKQFHSQGVNYQFLGDSGVVAQLTLARYHDTQEMLWGDGYFFDLDLTNNLMRGQIQWPLGSHTLVMGAEVSDKTFEYEARLVNFVCTDFDIDCRDARRDLIEDAEKLPIRETSIYIADNWQLTPVFNLEVGVQRSGNDHTGEYLVNPRASIAWDLHPTLTLIGSVGNYSRTPDVDTILGSIGNPSLLSPRARHTTLGVKGTFGDDWTWLVEAYHKELSRMALALGPDEDGGERFYSNDLEGETRGLDIMLNKNLTDRWYGWVALSLAESERTNRRTGETRTYTLDTPLVLSMVSHYQLNADWDMGLRFSYKSGEATTDIVGVQPNPHFPDRYSAVYGDPFGSRLPYYSRLDVRFSRDFLLWRRDASFFVDILNLLNRKNVIQQQLDFEQVQQTGDLHLRKDAEMGTFGSVGMSIRF